MHKINLYQTHLSEGQWSYINKVFFENDCRHRKYPLGNLFESVLYIPVTGCQWRMLPNDLPEWQTVCWYFQKWRKEGYPGHCIEKPVMKIRRKGSQHAAPSVMAPDSQSVKRGSRQSDSGFGANKKVKGIKRNTAVDRNGFIPGRSVSSAGVHDSRPAYPVCEQVADARPSVRKGLVDRRYRGELIEHIRRDFNIDIEVCATPNGTNGFTPKPLRRVVERTFAWFDGFRRLVRNYESTSESAEEIIDFANIKLPLNHVEL